MFGQYQVSQAEDNLNLGCGQPGNEYLTLALTIFNEKCYINNKLFEVMQYGKKDGHDIFKESIINTYFSNIPNIMRPHIFMTNGISQGIQMVTGLLRNNQCNTIYVEELTYFIMLNHFKDYKFNIKTFALDNLDNFIPEENSIIYIIPFCNNPTGKTITTKQLNNFVNIISNHDVTVLSDETYYLMQNSDIKPLYLYSPKIISFHTFSKIFAPGIRLGWLMTKNTKLIDKLNDSGFIDSGGSVNPIMGLIVASIIETSDYKKYFESMIESLKLKRELICKTLDLYPDIFSYTKPDGGYFIFVKLNNKFNIDSDDFLEICKQNKITFHQGWKFTTPELKNEYKNYFRLSCSYYFYDDIEKYFNQRLKNCVNDLLEKYQKKSQIIWVLGSTGRLGSLIVKELEIKSIKFKTIDRTFNLDGLKNHDIIVDVSSPEGTMNLLQKLMFNKYVYPKIIIGTTGNLPMNFINSYPEEIIIRSNFSEGVPLVLSLLEKFDKNIWTRIEIKDFHHVNKKDAPSGTAKSIVKKLNKIGFDDVKISSYREGDIIGIHEIVISNDVESIIIKHEAKDRRIFAIGCVNLICKLIL
jgi:DNA-binding transcriptional MocR family regulator/dihydrodipicolinate reductase